MFTLNTLSEQLRKNVRDEWGTKGEQWLQALPAIVKKCHDLWHLEIEDSSFELSYNYVTSVHQEDGSNAILQVGYPHEEFWNEMKALKVLDGHYSVRLLNADVDLGAMLLERIHPGTTLKSVQVKDDEEATRIAADILKNFPVPVPKHMQFPTVAEWTEVFKRMKKMKNSPLPLGNL